MSNLELILKEFDALKGQFVITESWKVERLVAIGEDEHDYYYITYNGRRLKFHTCIGRIVPLKGNLDEDIYNEFERLAELNHHDRMIGSNISVEHFEKLGQPVPTLDNYKKFLTNGWDKTDKLLTDIIFRDDK